MQKNVKYSEPKNYIPKEIQKKYGVGEFAKDDKTKKEEEKKRENEELRKVFKGK